MGRYFLCCLWAVMISGVCGVPSTAVAVQIPLKRIVLSKNHTSDTLVVTNASEKEQSYEIGWQHYRMEEERGILREVLPDQVIAGLRWADGFISFEPERMVLASGQTQKVRVVLKESASLSEGEYRGHIWVQSLIPEGDGLALPKGRMQMKTRPAISMPVFIRSGKTIAAVDIENVSMVEKEGQPHVKVIFSRTGNRSVYGDIQVVCRGGDVPFQAGQARGIGIYTEIARRVAYVPVDIPAEWALECQKMDVTYTARTIDALFQGRDMTKAKLSVNP